MKATLGGTQRKALGVLRDIGVFRLCSESRWRKTRLSILCYRGVSLHDEHEWDPGVYVSTETLDQRLSLLKAGRYSVLPLGEAIARLYLRTLPPRSVCITFDGGMYDFAARAAPLLERYGFPATVYLSSEHCEFPRPVFSLAIAYLIWKSRVDVLDARSLTGAATVWDLRTETGKAAAVAGIQSYADHQHLDPTERDALAECVAWQLGVDYHQFVATRRLQVLNPCEVATLSEKGFDFQLRKQHRTPLTEDALRREIRRSRERLRDYTGRDPTHFCYPARIYQPELPKWLLAEGVRSASTSALGVAGPLTPPLRLPRLIDNSRLTALEFEGWLTGLSSMLPHRSQPRTEAVP